MVIRLDEVSNWFSAAVLDDIMGVPLGDAGHIARWCFIRGGKRLRPKFLVGAYLAASCSNVVPDQVKKLAVAIECFHQASLIHDDIEDSDGERNGSPSCHAEFGLPRALNTGDLLIHEGYRLICETNRNVDKMVIVTSRLQRWMCFGQAADLSGLSSPVVAKMKTGSMFENALALGLIHCHPKFYWEGGPVTEFSNAFGVAFQLADDARDGLGVRDCEIDWLANARCAADKADGNLRAFLLDIVDYTISPAAVVPAPAPAVQS